MDDSWSFRTERGRAWVAGGQLRVRGSVAGSLRSTYHERWKRADSGWKVLYLLSFGGTLMWFGRVIPALEALVGPDSLDGMQWFTLAATAFLVLGVAWQIGRTERVPLERVEAVRRTGQTLTVEYGDPDGGSRIPDLRALTGGENRTLEIDALTDEDADRAVEALRLKGVRVEDCGGDAPDDGGDSDGIRDDDVTYDVLGRRS